MSTTPRCWRERAAAGGGAAPSGGIQRQVGAAPNYRDFNNPPPLRPGGAPWVWCKIHKMWCGHTEATCEGLGPRTGAGDVVIPLGTVKQTTVQDYETMQQQIASLTATIHSMQVSGSVHATIGQGGQQPSPQFQQQQQPPPQFQQQQQQQQQQAPQYQQYQQRQQQQYSPSLAGKETVRRPGAVGDTSVVRPCLYCSDERHGSKYCWIKHPELVTEELRATYKPPVQWQATYLKNVKDRGMRLPDWAGAPQGQVRYTQQQETASTPVSSSANFGAYAAEHSRTPSVAGAYPFSQQDARSEGNYSGYAAGSASAHLPTASGYFPPASQHTLHYTQVAGATTDTEPKEVRFALGVGDDRHPEEPAYTVNARPLPRGFGRIPRDSSTPVPSASASRFVHPLAATPAVNPAPVPNPADQTVTVLVEPSVSNVTIIVKTRAIPVAAPASQLLALHSTPLENAETPSVTPQVLASCLRKPRPGDTVYPSTYTKLPVLPLSSIKPGDPMPDFFHASEHSALVDVEALKASYAGSVATLPFLHPSREHGLSFPTGKDRAGEPAAIKKPLLDTGANVSVVDVDAVRVLGLTMTSSGGQCISTSTGAVEPVKGLLEDLICTLALGTAKQVQFRATFMCMETTDKSFDVILGVQVMKQLGLWADPLLQMVFFRPFLHDGSFNLTLSCLPLICVAGGQHTIKLSGCKLYPAAPKASLPAPEFCMGRVLKTTAHFSDSLPSVDLPPVFSMANTFSDPAVCFPLQAVPITALDLEQDVFYDFEDPLAVTDYGYDYEKVAPPAAPNFSAASPQVLSAYSAATHQVGPFRKQGWDFVWGGTVAVAPSLLSVDPRFSALLSLLLLCIMLYFSSPPMAWCILAGVALATISRTVLSILRWHCGHGIHVHMQCKSASHKHRFKKPRPLG